MKSRWNVICQLCGRKLLNTEAKKRWDGLIVCPNDWESKHPALIFGPHHRRRAGGEGTTASRSGGVRTEPADQFILVCDVYTSMGVVGYGTTGCARVGSYNTAFPLPPTSPPYTATVPYINPLISSDSSVIFLMRGFDAVNEYSSYNRTSSGTGSSGDSGISVATQSDFFTGTGITNTGTTGTAYIEFQLSSGAFPGGDITIDFWYKPSVSPSVGPVLTRGRVMSFYNDATLVAVISNLAGWLWFVLGSYSSVVPSAIGTRQMVSFQAGPGNGNLLSWWNDGTPTGFYPAASFPAFNKIRIGNDSDDTHSYGAIEEIRISTALKYIAAVPFTPPTTIFS